jgi:hypothetical protein
MWWSSVLVQSRHSCLAIETVGMLLCAAEYGEITQDAQGHNTLQALARPVPVTFLMGRAIAQAVSRWLPTAAARVRAWVWSCGICGGQSGAGAGFLRVLWFPLPIFVPPIAPQSPSSVIWGLCNRPEVAAVPSGLSPTPLKKTFLK